MIFNQSITRNRAGTRVTRSGDTVPDWSLPTTDQTFRRVSVQPASQAEDVTPERDERITRWRVYTRPGVDIDVLATDRVTYADETFQVVSEVARWPHPGRPGRVHHVEFTIQEVEG